VGPALEWGTISIPEITCFALRGLLDRVQVPSKDEKTGRDSGRGRV